MRLPDHNSFVIVHKWTIGGASCDASCDAAGEAEYDLLLPPREFSCVDVDVGNLLPWDVEYVPSGVSEVM